MNFFDYSFYRIARFYKSKNEEDYTLYGSTILAIPLGCIVLTIIILTLHGVTATKTPFYIVAVSIVGFCVLFFNKKRYLRLDESYNPDEDKNRKRKGRLIVLFIVGSFFAMILATLYVKFF